MAYYVGMFLIMIKALGLKLKYWEILDSFVKITTLYSRKLRFWMFFCLAHPNFNNTQKGSDSNAFGLTLLFKFIKFWFKKTLLDNFIKLWSYNPEMSYDCNSNFMTIRF